MLDRLRNSTLTLVLLAAGLMALWLYRPVIHAQQPDNTSTCLSNLRQIGLALRMYAEDYGAYPLANQDARGCAHWKVPTASGHYISLPDVTKKYLPAGFAFTCPAMRAAGKESTYAGDYGYMCGHDIQTTLGKITSSAAVNPDTCMVCGSKVADIKHPDTKIMAFCNTFGVHVAKSDDNVIFEGQTGGIPVCYVDGHVAMLTGSIQQFCQAAVSPK